MHFFFSLTVNILSLPKFSFNNNIIMAFEVTDVFILLQDDSVQKKKKEIIVIGLVLSHHIFFSPFFSGNYI